MDGYSVEEAAEVLGIPEGRVWELIARGVLAGVSEGRTDMRVFLRPAAGASGSSGPASGPDPLRSPDPGQSANGGGAHVESSPFRELLTEFRNLTERYGQALLALGEARGEVASLRSRVELLEARMDMRLPLRAASTVAWELPDRYPDQRAPAEASAPEASAPEASAPESPAPTAPAQESPAPADLPDPGPAPSQPAVDGEPLQDTDVGEPIGPATTSGVDVVVHEPGAALPEPPSGEAPKRRITGGRAAIAGLAEALARAEDPALADLPGAREAGEALAALRRETVPARPATAAPASETPAEPQADAAPEPAPEPEAETAVEAEADPVAEDIQAAFAPPIDAFDEPDAPATAQASSEHLDDEPPPTDEAQPSAYTTEVVEPDWFADGDFTWLDAPDPASGPSTPSEPPAGEARADEPTPASEPPRAEEPMPTSEPARAGEPSPAAERDHVEATQEAPAVEALQEAFEEPMFDDAPAPSDAIHAEAVAIQDAFDEPDAAHAAATAEAWPEQDRHSITGADAVGFNLFRSPGEPSSSETPRSADTIAPPTAEEELLWFGDEFEAGDLEMPAPGSRAGDPPSRPVPAATVAPAEPAMPDATISDEEIARLATDEGWNEAEIDAIRTYLGRPELPLAATEHAGEPKPVEPPTPAPGADDLDGPPASAAWDQDWLRGRRGPAATAYRRLRRIFQG